MEESIEKTEVGGTIQHANHALIRQDGKPIMIWRLGSEALHWVPGVKHFTAVRNFIHDSGLDKKYNVFVFHFGVDVEIIDVRPWWKRLINLK